MVRRGFGTPSLTAQQTLKTPSQGTDSSLTHDGYPITNVFTDADLGKCSGRGNIVASVIIQTSEKRRKQSRQGNGIGGFL